ncbi:hypothetical protein SLH46_07655 [Draconibacterium sp. IB214405]|uniref:hypothetical protein n=1 Tax=Draconibacterium sp. IB214405 TaxID=3097352 RepID=UPI002A13383F|nr:hypothetical protein [Draconibacterium sp. IB214405]MDX8339054.1 hypothetical protein [Draconibacterium sp. IB214405]
MKRSNQNIFMPFKSNGNPVMNRLSNKRKSSLMAAFSNLNRSIEGVNFVHCISTQKDDTDFYTTYDLDAENAGFVSETKSDPRFIFDATVVDRTDSANREPIQNKETPIISLHWAEITDHDSLIEQNPEDGKVPVNRENILADEKRDHKPYFWFV